MVSAIRRLSLSITLIVFAGVACTKVKHYTRTSYVTGYYEFGDISVETYKTIIDKTHYVFMAVYPEQIGNTYYLTDSGDNYKTYMTACRTHMDVNYPGTDWVEPYDGSPLILGYPYDDIVQIEITDSDGNSLAPFSRYESFTIYPFIINGYQKCDWGVYDLSPLFCEACFNFEWTNGTTFLSERYPVDMPLALITPEDLLLPGEGGSSAYPSIYREFPLFYLATDTSLLSTETMSSTWMIILHTKSGRRYNAIVPNTGI